LKKYVQKLSELINGKTFLSKIIVNDNEGLQVLSALHR
jgi:hypothetical protein